MSFRVDLDIFRGPVDLLLYLVRKHELDILDIPMSLITSQYLEHIAVLEQLDVNAVGDFLELASILIEIKSRMMLPRVDEEDGELEDPREELVRRLLEYKKYRDAASMLEERSRQWQKRYARLSHDQPVRSRDWAAEPIREVELWDLVSAFGRLLRKHKTTTPSNIVYDETPIKNYMLRLHDRILSDRRITLSDMYSPGMHKSALIGVFLAILELVRHQHVRAEQNQMHGEIWILRGKQFGDTLDLSKVQDHAPEESSVNAD